MGGRREACEVLSLQMGGGEKSLNHAERGGAQQVLG